MGSSGDLGALTPVLVALVAEKLRHTYRQLIVFSMACTQLRAALTEEAELAGKRALQAACEASAVDIEAGCVNLSVVGAAEDFAHIVGLSPKLSELTVSTAGALGDDGACQLFRAMACNRGLTTLTLDQNGISVKGVIALAEMLEANTTLKGLQVNSELIQQAGAAALAKALCSNSSLEWLSLCGEFAECFIWGVGSHGRCQGQYRERAADVDVSGLEGQLMIGDEAMTALGRALPQMSLQQFSVEVGHIGRDGAAALGAALAHNPPLKLLALSFSLVTDSNAQLIISGLESNSNLELLEMRYNLLGEAAGVALGQCLAHNSALTSVVLPQNAINDAAACVIAASLAFNSTLQSLDLSGNSIFDQGATAFGEALKSNIGLTNLNLMGQTGIAGHHAEDDGLSDSGAIALAASLGSNATLLELHLSSNKIYNVGAAAFTEVIPHLTTLRYLDLHDCLFDRHSFSDSAAAAVSASPVEILIADSSFSSPLPCK